MPVPTVAADRPIMTWRLSYLSASHPAGTCDRSPPSTNTARNPAISPWVSPIRSPNTGPAILNAADGSAADSTAATASGEHLTASSGRSRGARTISGGRDVVSASGSSARQQSIARML